MNIENIVLSRGSHTEESGEHCLLEVVSMFSGEPFGDSPKCVDPVLAEFGRSWNDSMRSDAERAQLKQYIMRLPGTAKGEELSIKRSWMAFDWLIRVQCVAWMSMTPALKVHADILMQLPAITCKEEFDLALPKINDALAAARTAARAVARDAARDAAWTVARDAAWTVARDAARAAARASARDAARDAARAVARDAARDAAWTVARDAARDAAWTSAEAALEPTVLKLQVSAHDLFSRMIDAV
jgi:hypothetical protein